jgi:hypothetical protein
MEERWQDKNIDLSMLSERIVRFFNNLSFATSLRETEEKYIVTAIPESFHGIGERIEITISGKPNDFSVRFNAGSRSRILVRYGSFVTLLTGGYFLLKGLRSQEELEKLQKRFRIYVSETVWYLFSAK